LCFVLILSGCNKEGTVQPTSEELVEGNWKGTLNGITLEINFIEGEFEGYPTLTGSANFISNNEMLSYKVMGGTIVRKSKKVWFALNKIPVVEKEEYHIEGTVSGTWINGTYEKLTQSGEIIETGTWNVKKLP